MASVEEQLTEQFYAWEARGRGWKLFDRPISPEPPFRPFYGHYLPAPIPVDDGRKPTFLSSLFDRFSDKSPTTPPAPTPELETEPEPESFPRDSLIELQTSLPSNLAISRESFDQLLSNLAYCREPLSFELLGLPDQIVAQLAVHPRDAPTVLRQLTASFPEAVFTRHERILEQAWNDTGEIETAIVEFGLEREFMLPLATVRNFNQDPLIGLTGALSELQPGELGLFQVIFQPVSHPWAESIVNSVSDSQGKPFFVNAPELLSRAESKVERPLHAAVVRIATKSDDWDRTWDIARDLAAALRVFAHPQGNEFIPLPNNGYVFEQHVEDVLLRQTRRSGMILNRDELISLVHLPSASVRDPKLKREVRKTKAAPKLGTEGSLLGFNHHAGQSRPVFLTPDQRVRHLHLIGASGTGKSTLLFNLIRQDIEDGQGVAVFDPHGDLVEKLLGIIPPERIDDVVLVDPSDEAYSIGFNILSAHSDLEKNLLASDLVSVFQRLSTSWGDQMGSVLQNAILAFLESSQGGTLADLQRFLIDPGFRNSFLKTVRDPNVVFYWQKAFPQLGSGKSIGPVLTRLEKLLSLKPVRYMVSQPVNRLDFARILDTGKIFLAKLSQGQIGKENSYLLGSLLVAKFQQLAMGRQRMNAAERRDFFLYLDEAHNFITPSMAEILAGARKYRVGLVFAHQDLQQLQRDPDVAGAVMSNCYTRVVFRVGDTDAKKLSEGFAYFEAQDLQNLGTGEAIARIERSDGDFNLKVPPSDEPDPNEAATIRAQVITVSRKKYGTARKDIEAEQAAASVEAEEPKKESRPASKPVETMLPPPEKSEDREPAPIPKSTAVETIPPVPPPSKQSEPTSTHITEPEITQQPQPVTAAQPIQPPQDKGIGGNQHNLIRERIELVARQLGYTTSREDATGNGQKIDVVLQRPDRSVACEIAITTTIDHEVGNVAKCLKGGFREIVVISPSLDRLQKIEVAVRSCVPADEAARVAYFQPDKFTEYLQAFPVQGSAAQSTPNPSERKFGKYKIKRSAATLTPEELEKREAAGLAMLAEAMREKK